MQLLLSKCYIIVVILVAIFCSNLLFAATPTETSTPTPTASPTASPTPFAESRIIFNESFQGMAGNTINGWVDCVSHSPSEYRASIKYSPDGTYALVSRTTVDIETWGKVHSTALVCNPIDYPILELTVNELSPNTTWKIVIQEKDSPVYFAMAESQTTTGTARIDIAALSGWNEIKNFYIQINLEGISGTHMGISHLSLTGPVPAIVPNQFVIVDPQESEQLSLDGHIVKIKGVNYYPSAHGWEKMWPQWDAPMIYQELGYCEQFGFNTIRAFIHYDDFGQNIVKPELLARMEQFLYIANSYNLKVEWVFFPLSRNYAPSNWQPMKDHVTTIVNAFNNDPRILGWQITNEFDIEASEGVHHDVEETNAINWHNEMAAHLKRLGASQLIIAGTARPETVQDIELNNIDVYDLHTGDTNYYEKGLIVMTKKYLNQKGVSKPILFQEFGYNLRDETDEVRASNFFGKVFNGVYDCDISGAMIWLLVDSSSSTGVCPWGVCESNGVTRNGYAMIKNVYQGTYFANPSNEPNRPVTVTSFKHPIGGPQQLALNAVMPNVLTDWEDKWSRCDYAAEDKGMKIDTIVRLPGERLGWGTINSVVNFEVDLDQEADININIRELNGEWFAFLGVAGTDHEVRLQGHTNKIGFFNYNIKDYLPSDLAYGNRSLFLTVGALETVRTKSPPLGTSEGVNGPAYVYVENISLANGIRMAPAPTPEQCFWSTACEGPFWTQPQDWTDETEDAGFDAHISYAANGYYAVVTRNADNIWGKVLSPLFNCNIQNYNRLSVTVPEVSVGAQWKLGVQEIGGAGEHAILVDADQTTGTVEVDLRDHLSWATTRNFKVEVVIEGSSGQYILIDAMKLYSVSDSTSTPTATPTFISTQTPTATPNQWAYKESIIAAPNPAKDIVHFWFHEADVARADVHVYSMAGNRIAHIERSYNIQSETNEIVWSIPEIAPGIYFYRIMLYNNQNQQIRAETKKLAIIK